MIFQTLVLDLSILGILLFIAGIVFSIAFHEFAHAKSAQMLGDPTPEYQGRVTLNPLAHLDPIGTIALFFGPMGWGKPVQVNPNNMGAYPERKYFVTSLAGPVSNLFLALVLFIIMFIMVNVMKSSGTNIVTIVNNEYFRVIVYLFQLNIALAIFNLIPIPPLDGSKIWGVLLSYDQRITYERFINRYNILLLILLVAPIIPSSTGATSIASIVTSPIISFIFNTFFGLIF